MKPGYKIIIAGLLIYGGFKIKAVMDVAPYKEKAVLFAGLLKQNKSFEAQALLSSALQNSVSIEKLHALIQEQNLTQSKEISWLDWRKDDENYILRGEFVFVDTRKLAVEFNLFSREENKTWIEGVKIGGTDLNTTEGTPMGFLK
jgi:hypothetical protein